ncbi:unnamed protein product [Caenorhabditis auriculariae]|uniref:Uncharacterized protein n=1 Tax=Caenorhabditis auriculariae TaxID=2777116 RepID=A0A8S1HTJ1_9PELO|nr:unnamed protein product [Caenorhabditis auriculariae]
MDDVFVFVCVLDGHRRLSGSLSADRQAVLLLLQPATTPQCKQFWRGHTYHRGQGAIKKEKRSVEKGVTQLGGEVLVRKSGRAGAVERHPFPVDRLIFSRGAPETVMKSVVLLALLGAALALRGGSQHLRSIDNLQKDVQESAFRSGREYRYRFDGQLSAGLPLPTAQHGMTRVQALVSLQMTSDKTFLMQLNRVQFANSQDKREPRTLQPIESFEKISMEKEHQDLLSLPVEFQYRHGMISEIRFSDDDQTWSENIKRAVVNMLQVNILKKSQVHGDSEESDEARSFVSVERTLEGECEVFYTQEQRRESEQQWTKSINFDKCTQRPEVRRTFAPICEDCDSTLNKDKMSSSVFTYNLTGTPDNFLIHQVELKSQHLFAPISEKQQLLGAFVSNKLELVYAGKKETEIPAVRGERTQHLVYDNKWELAEEKFAQTGEEKHLRQLPKWENKVEMVEKMFVQMGKQVEEGVSLETAHFVSRIVKVLRFCNEEEVSKVHRQLTQSSQFSEKTAEHLRGIFYNCLALAGTRVTIHQLGEKIQEQKYISPVKAAQTLKSLVDMRSPSVEIAEEILRICESDASASSPVLRQSCWLTYGSVVNGFCVPQEHIRFAERDTKKMCPRDFKLKVVRQLIENFKSASTNYEKTLALKSIANAGLDVSVVELEKIIYDQTEEKTIRVQAIEALRLLNVVMPRKIQQLLMPIYKSRQQPVQVRMSALNQILRSKPEIAVLSQVADQIKQERSQQVRSFTISMLQSFADNQSPCQKTFSALVERILAAVPEQQLRLADSRYGSWSAYSQKYQTGLDFNWGAIFTNESVLPNDIMASIDGMFAGEWNEYIAQIGLTQQNVDKIIRQVIAKVQETGFEEIVVRGKRSTSFRPTEILNNLLEKLRISRRSHNAEEPQAMLYVRFRGMDYAFVPFDAETIPEMVKSMIQGGKIQIGEIERIFAQGIHFSTSGAFFGYESYRRIPTALGMPVRLSSKMPTVSTINGNVKFEIEPKNGKKINGLRFHLQAQPKVASTHVTSLSIMCPVVEAGTKLLHQAVLDTPINTQVHINWEKKIFIQTTTKVPREQLSVVQLQSRPVTFVRVWSQESRQYPEPTEMTLRFPQKSQYLVSNIQRDYFEKSGLKVSVSGSIHRPVFPTESHIPKPLLIANNDLEIVVEPTENTPKDIITIFEAELFRPSELLEPQMDKIWEKKESSRFMEVEEDEYDQDERLTHVSKYVKNMKKQKAIEHKIIFEMKTSGHSNDLFFKSLITANCNQHMSFCKTEVEFQRSAVEGENRQWQLEATIQTLYPQMPKTIQEMSEQKNRDFVALCEMNWGAHQSNKMTLKVQGQQSRQQREWLKRADRKQNMLSEQEKLAEAARLNTYQIAAEYELTKPSQRFFEYLQTMVETRYGNIWLSEYETVEKDQGRMRAQLTIEPRSRQTANLTVETPSQRMTIRDMRLPYALPTAQIHYTSGSQRQQHPVQKLAQKITKQAECVVKSKEIQTFDDVFYRAPITPCYSVLAKDCGSNQPEFVVLMKQVKKGGDAKNVKVINNGNEVEMELKNERLHVTVNGKKVEYDEEKEQENNKEINVEWYNEKMVKIVTEPVTVQFDGVVARVHLSALYKNQQCGLCGHYDDEHENEFRGADNEEKTDIQEFAKSFLYKDEECEMDDETMNKKSNFRRINEETSSSEEDNQENQDENEPKQKTIIVERPHHTCFSQEQQPECDESSKAVETRKQKVDFICVPAHDAESRRLMRVARREPLSAQHLEQLQNLDKSEKRTIVMQLPKRCELAEFAY